MDNKPIVSDQTPWYSIKLFSPRLSAVRDWATENELEHFVPMEYADILDHNNHRRRVLRPVVSNLLFVKKTMTEQAFRALVSSSPYPMSVFRKDKDSREYYEISAHEMREFQIMCNPEIELRKYITEEEAELKAGTPVLVKYGPLKGLSGKLVRANKKYFLVKEVPGMAVMLKVARWCCTPVLDTK